MLIFLVISVCTARYLGPNRFGMFSYAQSFVALFLVLSTLGLEGLVIRELVIGNYDRDVILGTSFFLQVSGSIILLGIMLLIVELVEFNSDMRVLILILTANSLMQPFRNIIFYFQSKVRSKFVVFAQVISLLFSLGGTFLLIYLHAEIQWFAILIFLESAVLATGLIVIYAKQGLSVLGWRFDNHVAINLLKESWALILSGIVISIYMKIDQLMISNMLGNNAVGFYAAAVRLSEAWYFIPMVIAGSLFPAIINAKKHSIKVYHERLQMLYDLSILTAVTIAILISSISDWIILNLYGKPFISASGVLAVHIWACVFFFLGSANGRWLIVEGYTKIAFARNFIGAAINIILNLILIPIMGIMGAAFATIFSLVFAFHLYFLFHKKTRNMFKMQNKSFFVFFRLKRGLWKFPI
jgi:O-antigen/teichoic acid export membrane protein